ncbi:hypothetical protein [Salibacterium aidingense]|uniref:hypothetical protein n=1 Tax=Salibacterium aidingense TaxID=384933 RepID=UPI003BE0BC25
MSSASMVFQFNTKENWDNQLSKEGIRCCQTLSLQSTRSGIGSQRVTGSATLMIGCCCFDEQEVLVPASATGRDRF